MVPNAMFSTSLLSMKDFKVEEKDYEEKNPKKTCTQARIEGIQISECF
jgi:hypothetical protein